MMPMGVQACYGGNWDNGANAGLFYANANNAPSNANSNIGARLAKDVFGHCIAYHAHANAWRTLSGLLADTSFCKEGTC